MSAYISCGMLTRAKCQDVWALKTAGRATIRAKLAHNTYLWFDSPDYVVRLHGTDILRFRPDGSVAYNTGGYRTRTTLHRLRELGPAAIRCERGLWIPEGVELFFDGYSTDPAERQAYLGFAQDRKYGAKLFADWLLDRGRLPVVYGMGGYA